MSDEVRGTSRGVARVRVGVVQDVQYIEYLVRHEVLQRLKFSLEDV